VRKDVSPPPPPPPPPFFFFLTSRMGGGKKKSRASGRGGPAMVSTIRPFRCFMALHGGLGPSNLRRNGFPSDHQCLAGLYSRSEFWRSSSCAALSSAVRTAEPTTFFTPIPDSLFLCRAHRWFFFYFLVSENRRPPPRRHTAKIATRPLTEPFRSGAVSPYCSRARATPVFYSNAA